MAKKLVQDYTRRQFDRYQELFWSVYGWTPKLDKGEDDHDRCEFARLIKATKTEAKNG